MNLVETIHKQTSKLWYTSILFVSSNAFNKFALLQACYASTLHASLTHDPTTDKVRRWEAVVKIWFCENFSSTTLPTHHFNPGSASANEEHEHKTKWCKSVKPLKGSSNSSSIRVLSSRHLLSSRVSTKSTSSMG